MLPTTRSVMLAVMLTGILCRCGNKEPSTSAKPSKHSDSLPPIPVQARVPALDKSAMDMIYYPENYPILKMSGKMQSPPIARVIYSRPFKNGRVIFGDVVKYGSRWRLGANEATEIEFFRNVTISGQKVNKGRYILYCIPFEDKWTIILNNDLYTWGLKINQSMDAYRFEAPITHINVRYEVFTMEFDTMKEGFALNMAWDNVHTSLPINE